MNKRDIVIGIIVGIIITFIIVLHSVNKVSAPILISFGIVLVILLLIYFIAEKMNKRFYRKVTGNNISANVQLDYGSARSAFAYVNATDVLSKIDTTIDYFGNKKAKSHTSPIGLFFILGFILLIIALLTSNISYTAPRWSPMLVIFGILFLAVSLVLFGFEKYSNYIILSNTPISKMESANIGFSILNGRFTTADGKQLTSPISKVPCTFYNVILYYVTEVGNRHITIIVDSIVNGLPTYLTDGTGYTALDFTEFPFSEITTYSLEKDGKFLQPGKNIEDINKLQNLIENAKNTGNELDFSSTNINFNKTGKLGSNKEGYYVDEYVIPTDKNYIAVGTLYHSDYTINGKRVNILRKGGQTGISSIYPGSQKVVSKNTLMQSVELFAVSAFLILLIAYIASTHNFYSCLYTTSSSKGAFCYYITTNGIAYLPLNPKSQQSPNTTSTTILPSTVPPSQESSTTTLRSSTSLSTSLTTTIIYASVNCNGLNVSSSNFSSTASASCAWSGGNITVYAVAGSSGFISFKIIGSNGKVYLSTHTTSWCEAQVNKVNLPAQNYTVQISTGSGGGSCGAAYVALKG